VVIQGGGSRQPVDANNNAEIPFNYPQIEFENEAELQVQSLPYRAYSAGAASGGGSVETTANNSDFTNVVFSEDERTSLDLTDLSWTTVTTFSIPFGTQVSTAHFGQTFSAAGLEEDSETVNIRLEDTTTNTFYPDSSGFQGSMNVFSDSGAPSGASHRTESHLPIVIAEDISGHDIEVQAKMAATDGYPTSWKNYAIANGPHTHSVSIPFHTHDVEPGIQEFSQFPSNVDVIIDGNTVATNVLQGTSQTVVDISGELTQGAWNDIELTSDTLGHIQATVSVSGYRQIGKQP
jgi:hypothetical protein